jgi:hypothetical protein
MSSYNPPYPYFNGITYNKDYFETSGAGLSRTQENALSAPPGGGGALTEFAAVPSPGGALFAKQLKTGVRARFLCNIYHEF